MRPTAALVFDVFRGVFTVVVSFAVLYPGTPHALRIAGGMILACAALSLLITDMVRKIRSRSTDNTNT